MKFSIESIMCQYNVPIQDDSGTYRSIDEIEQVGLGWSAVGCKGDLPLPLASRPPAAVRLMWDKGAMTGRIPLFWHAGSLRLDQIGMTSV